MNILEMSKKYRSHIALVSTLCTAGAVLFARIDAYAQGKVDAGVNQLRGETMGEVTQLKTDVQILKAEQLAQKEQLNRIDQKQDDMIHLLLEMKRDGGK